MVSGRSASGALVRFHLNDSLVASVEASGEGRVSFAIGQGVQPGAYRIRLDEVDPTSGGVRSGAEVNFAVPVHVALSHSEPKSAASGEVRIRSQTGARSSSRCEHRDRSKARKPLAHQQPDFWEGSSLYGDLPREPRPIRNPNRIYPGQTSCCQPTRCRPGAKLIEYPERLRSTELPPTHWPGAGVVPADGGTAFVMSQKALAVDYLAKRTLTSGSRLRRFRLSAWASAGETRTVNMQRAIPPPTLSRIRH